MSPESLSLILREIINKNKWWEILSRFIEVLRINIFILDTQGQIVLPPEGQRYGGRFLMDPHFRYTLPRGSPSFIEQFEPQGRFYEFTGPFDLHTYAIPIPMKGKETISYLIVGPVILNHRLERFQYEQLAVEYGVDPQALLAEIYEIRVVSHVMMDSILDLLYKIIRDHVEFAVKEREFQHTAFNEKKENNRIKKVSEEICATVHLDELLVTLLDVALKMTDTECGSIMILDEKNGFLTIKVARGLDEDRIAKVRVKLGEGIAGLAAKEKTHFVIERENTDNRIKHLLKRPEIRHSLVMPLMVQNRLLGVLNLSSKKDQASITENLGHLQHLSQLLSSIF